MNLSEEINWRLWVGAGKEESEISPEKMKAYSCSKLSDNTICRTWKGFEDNDDFEVNVILKPQTNGLLEGRISWKNYHGVDPVAAVDFPWRTVDCKEDGGVLTGDVDSGLIFLNKNSIPGRVYQLGRQAVMLLAFLNSDNTGHYFDVHDPDSYVVKSTVFQFNQEKTKLSGGYRHRIGFPEGPDGALPYVVHAGDFKGSWFEAGQLYKPWAIQQKWWTARTKENSLRNIGMWVWNRGLAKDAVDPVIQLQKDLPGVQVALDWYWWHNNPYDTDYPGFWPPREGEESFRKTIAEAKKHGLYSQVYINGVCMDIDSDFNSEADREEVLMKKDGSLQCFAFNQWNQHRLGWTCGHSPHFQEKICKLVKQLRECGLSGQYLDQINCSTAKCCYNPKHDHPKGGGTWVVQGWRDFLKRVREENPGHPLSSEGCAENYMDLFDGAIACTAVSVERFGGKEFPVPLFTEIYHGRHAQAIFGNYAMPDGIPPWDPLWPAEGRWKTEKKWHELYPEVFYMELIRNVVFGMQPMVHNMTSRIQTDPEFAEIYKFILDTAKFYHANLEYLFDGTMENPAGFECRKITVKVLPRSIFTPEEKCKEIEIETPAILHGIWRAPNGSCKLFMGNMTNQVQQWKYKSFSGTLQPHAYAAIELEKAK